MNADWLNDVQENIVAVILAAGLSPTKGRASDLLDAIHQRIEAITGSALTGIDDLRANTVTQRMVFSVSGTDAIYWFKDPTNTTAVDDGITCIVDAIGQRWRPRPIAGGIVYDDGSDLEQFKPSQPGATNSKTFVQTAIPTDDLHEGDLWFDSDDGNKQYRYNGTIWEEVIDTGSQTGRDLALAAFNLGLSIEQVVSQGGLGSAVTALNVNDWSGEWTPTNRSHKIGISVNRSTGRVTVKHRGHNGHTGTATAALELEVLGGNTIASYVNIDAETTLTGSAGTPIDFTTNNVWGPNGLKWSETITNTETDSFEVYLASFPVVPSTVFRLKVTQLTTTDTNAFSWVFAGDKPVIVDPTTPFQLVFSISDTSDNDALLLVNGPAVPNADSRSTTIGIRPNYSSFTLANPGEAYIHGFAATGSPADVDAFMVWNGAILTVEKQTVYTGSTGAGYIVFDTTKSGKFVISGQGNHNAAFAVRTSLGWTYDNNTAVRTSFTPTETDVVIGTMKADNDNVLEANVWPYGLSISVVSQAGADVTSENTAADVAAVYGTPSSVIASGAASGQQLADALVLAGLSQTIADFVAFSNQGGMSYPLANLNVKEWFDSPYSPPTAGAMFRIRIDRPAKQLEVLFGGFSGHTGSANVAVELEVLGGNSFTAYANNTAETSLTGSSGTPIDFTVDNVWGPNGLRWTETATGIDQDKFVMTLNDVPGAGDAFRLRVYELDSASYTAFLALGDLMIAANPQLPLQIIFCPVDGTDYDVLTMTNAPRDAGATNSKTFRQTTAPANPADDLHEGDVWFDTDDGNHQYRWNGTTWEDAQDAGAAAGAALSLDFASVGTSVSALAAASELTPHGATNVAEWYDSPYSPVVEAVMFRIRIDRPAKKVELLFQGFNGFTGSSSIDVELEVSANTFTAYSGISNETSLTGSGASTIDFSTPNVWGSNGLRWTETTTGTSDGDKIEMTLASVPGALTAFRLRVRSWTGTTQHLALGNCLALVDRTTPYTIFFTPTDGTDLDVLVMNNAPRDAGATNSKTFRQITAPANPADDLHEGDLWYDTDDGNRSYRWSGSAWVGTTDSGSETGRDITDAVVDYNLDSTVYDFVSRINRSAEYVGAAAMNVNTWDGYATVSVRSALVQVKIDKTNNRVYVRFTGATGHTGTAEAAIELEAIDNTVTSITNVSSSLTPSGSNVTTVDFSAAIVVDTLLWGKNGLTWRETFVNTTAKEIYVTMTSSLSRAQGFRLRVRLLETADSSAVSRITLGDSVQQANPAATIVEAVFTPVDSVDYDVLLMTGSAPIRQGTGGSFRNGFEGQDFGDWTGTPAPTSSSDAYSGTVSGLFVSSAASPSATGTTGASKIKIPANVSVGFWGRKVKVTLYAKKPGSGAATTFRACYSPNTSTETSGWQSFNPTTSWAAYSFTYTLPTSPASATDHYIGIHGDSAGAGNGVLIDNLLVELVAAATDIDAGSLLNYSTLVTSIETSANENTTPSTLFSGGSDNQTWVDLVSTTLTCTGTDLVVINGSAELLIDQTVDNSGVTILSSAITSSSGWTLGAYWDLAAGRLMHTNGSQASTATYALTGLTAGKQYAIRFAGSQGITSSSYVTMSLSSSDAVPFDDSGVTTLSITNEGAQSATLLFTALGTTATVTFTPTSFSGFIDTLEVWLTAPGLKGAPVQRYGFGPGGPTLRWRLRRGSTTIYESQDFLVSGAGQVPALFFDHFDTSAAAGSNTYKIQLYWDKGSYSSGNLASWDISAGRKSFIKGSGTYWNTYLSGGSVVTISGTSPSITAEIVSVVDNLTAIVVPTHFVPYTQSFSSGTSATIAVPSGCSAARLKLWGGGGGGGRSTSGVYAGGGGGGGYIEKFVNFTSSDAGKNFTYTIGAGGAGRTVSAGTGSTGGTSTVTTSGMSFTNLNLSAGGGTGGQSNGTGGSGGTSSGGDENNTGASGVSFSGGKSGDGNVTGTTYGVGGTGADDSFDGSTGNAGRFEIEWLADSESSTTTAYTSTNPTHSLKLRMNRALIHTTEYRNAPSA